MRTLIVTLLCCAALGAQDLPPAAPPPAPIRVDAVPLAPLDADSPYASPRDAARHRFQATLSELTRSRDIKAAVQGFAEALRLDSSYAAAAWNLGIVAALAEKWQDAIAALEESARLDPATFGKPAATQTERLRLIVSLSASPEGQRKRRYDEALYPALQRMGKAGAADTMAALVEVGRIDPKRWEAPAMLASVNGELYGYATAARFLEIAAANGSDPGIKTKLESALRAARREVSYAAALSEAEAASDTGDYQKAARLYETAWTTVPARAENGLESAADWLVDDDTEHATTLLLKLKQSPDSVVAATAGKMLDALKTVEPSAGNAPPDVSAFYREAGSAEPVRLQDMLPKPDLTAMEVLARPLARMVEDNQPVVLLSSLARDRVDGAAATSLPQLSAPRIGSERPWSDLQASRRVAPVEAPVNHMNDTADLPGPAKGRRLVAVTTRPAGALIFVGSAIGPLCISPCDIQAPAGSYELRVKLNGYDEQTSTVKVGATKTDVELELVAARGTILMDAPAPATGMINGNPVPGQLPLEISLAPGLYRVALSSGTALREQNIMVKPEAHLRFAIQP